MFPKLLKIYLLAFLARRLEVRYAPINTLVASFKDEALICLLSVIFVLLVAQARHFSLAHSFLHTKSTSVRLKRNRRVTRAPSTSEICHISIVSGQHSSHISFLSLLSRSLEQLIFIVFVHRISDYGRHRGSYHSDWRDALLDLL